MTGSVSHQLSNRRKKKNISENNTLACEQPPPALEKIVSILQACQQVLPTFTWENFGFWSI